MLSRLERLNLNLVNGIEKVICFTRKFGYTVDCSVDYDIIFKNLIMLTDII